MTRSTAPFLALVLAFALVPLPALAQEASPLVDREEVAPAASMEGAVRIARFVQTTDAQLVDDDFPFRPTALDPINPPFGAAERPQDEHVDEALNTLIGAINALHAEEPLDFVLNTGDAVDNALENEVQRYIDNFDGTYTQEGPLTGWAWKPDGQSSGIDDHENDVTDAATSLPAVFKEPGYNVPLTEDLPWYVAIGNHDTLINGNMPREPGFNEAAAESGRYFLSEPEFVRMMFAEDPCRDGIDSTLLDDGHGFAFAGDRLCDADPYNHGYYAFTHGLVRYVALNTVNGDWARSNEHTLPGSGLLGGSHDGAPVVGGYAEGSLDIAQYEWLLGELAAHADVPVILFAHHTPESIYVPEGASEAGFVDGARLADTLTAHANVVAYVGAHSHKHAITPKDGWWNVETASLIDAPHENRLVEVWVTPDGSAFIESRPIAQSYAPLAEAAKTDAQAEPDAAGTEKDRAVRLWFPLEENVFTRLATALDNARMRLDIARPLGVQTAFETVPFTVTATGGFTGLPPVDATVRPTVKYDELVLMDSTLRFFDGVGSFTWTFVEAGMYNVSATLTTAEGTTTSTRVWILVKPEVIPDPLVTASDDSWFRIPAPGVLSVLALAGVAGARRRD